MKADGPASPERTSAFFDALGRSTGFTDWQFRQALHAVRLLGQDILALAWAAEFPLGLALRSRPIARNHPPYPPSRVPPPSHALPLPAIHPTRSPFRPPSPADKVSPPGETETLAQLDSDLRRTIRLKHLAVATRETYTNWVARFTRFCYRSLDQSPAASGPPAVAARPSQDQSR